MFDIIDQPYSILLIEINSFKTLYSKITDLSEGLYILDRNLICHVRKNLPMKYYYFGSIYVLN